jgi:hypothetical protein
MALCLALQPRAAFAPEFEAVRIMHVHPPSTSGWP